MKIVIQMGHVARTSGATGTHREQEFAKLIGPKLKNALTIKGHEVGLIGADDTIPKCDLFLALHVDGNKNKAIRGASVGYPSNDPNSLHGKMANAWKRWHQHGGYPGGFHKDNYTEGLRFYYGFGKVNAKYEYLAEHGTSTNPADEAWLFANIDRCVAAHVNAIGEVVGHPGQITPPLPVIPPSSEDDDMKPRLVRAPDGAVFVFDGVVLRTANNPVHRDLMKWYGAEPKDKPWDDWSQEQIDSVPKVTPGS